MWFRFVGACVFNVRALLVVSLFTLGACTKKAPVDLSAMTPEQQIERGRLIYAQNCIACHNINPKLDGAVGPAVPTNNPELIHSKVLLGKYPEGYKPSRPTTVMPPMPQMEKEMLVLQAYISSLGE